MLRAFFVQPALQSVSTYRTGPSARPVRVSQTTRRAEVLFFQINGTPDTGFRPYAKACRRCRRRGDTVLYIDTAALLNNITALDYN
jgi:hypothetical protein